MWWAANETWSTCSSEQDLARQSKALHRSRLNWQRWCTCRLTQALRALSPLSIPWILLGVWDSCSKRGANNYCIPFVSAQSSTYAILRKTSLNHLHWQDKTHKKSTSTIASLGENMHQKSVKTLKGHSASWHHSSLSNNRAGDCPFAVRLSPWDLQSPVSYPWSSRVPSQPVMALIFQASACLSIRMIADFFWSLTCGVERCRFIIPNDLEYVDI